MQYFIYLGFVTDGEFNSLRTKGEKRPLHVVQLIRNARESVSKKSEAVLLKLIVRTGGTVVTIETFILYLYVNLFSSMRNSKAVSYEGPV